MISVVIPTLNAQASLARALAPLVEGVVAGVVREVIVSDGGSADDTCAIADAAGCTLVQGAQGRGVQLVAGAARARARWLLFLHADTALEPGWTAQAQRFMEGVHADTCAAAFRFALDDESPAARRLEVWVSLRCRVLKLPYGDQGLLIARELYEALGGFRPIPLMEDVDLVRRLGPRRLQILPARAVTSAARFQRDGYITRSAGNLWLLARFLLGADPEVLARRYG